MESFGFIIIETLVGGLPADCSIPAGRLSQLKGSLWLSVPALPFLIVSIVQIIHNQAAVLRSEGCQMAAANLTLTPS